MKVCGEFYVFFRLKPNNSNGEIVGIGLLTRVKLTLCGIECIDLTTCIVKTYGVRLS